MLWWEYMFPRRGQVLASGRRYQNRVVMFIYSIGFYATITVAGIFIFLQGRQEIAGPPRVGLAQKDFPVRVDGLHQDAFGGSHNSQRVAQNPSGGLNPSPSLPNKIDPMSRSFFNPVTGEPQVWYRLDSEGNFEFFDSQAFDPNTGEALKPVDGSTFNKWRDQKERQSAVPSQVLSRNEQEEKEQAAREERQAATERAESERKAAAARGALERQVALELEQKKARAAASCDDLAGNPADTRKSSHSSGSSYGDLKGHVAEALDACLAAMGTAPDEPRFKYQYARALEVNDPAKAIPLYKELTRQNYPAAFDNLGNIYIRKRDMRAAISVLKEGVKANDPDSMVTMADLVERGYVPVQNPAAAKYGLLERAAQLGHAGAQQAVAQMKTELQEQQQERAFQQQEQQMMINMFGTILRGVGR